MDNKTLDEIEKELKEEILLERVIDILCTNYYNVVKARDILELIQKEITRIFNKYKEKKNG